MLFSPLHLSSSKGEDDGPYSGVRETAIDTLVHRADGSIAPVKMTD
jgi:hypothetical protein